MSTMTEQTKRAIAALRAAGFKRGEYAVRSPRNKYGEYQDAQVTMFCRMTVERMTDDVVAALLNGGLSVDKMVWQGELGEHHTLFRLFDENRRFARYYEWNLDTHERTELRRGTPRWEEHTWTRPEDRGE